LIYNFNIFESFNREGETPEQLWSRLVNLIISGRAGEVSGIGGESYVFSQMKRLLKKNPQLIDDVCDLDSPSESALLKACKSELDSLAKFLINNGADVNKGDQFNCTPLHQSAVNKNPIIAKLLIDAGANPNSKTKGGATPLILVFQDIRQSNEDNALEAFKIIYNAGGDPYYKDMNGMNVWDFVEYATDSRFMFFIKFQRLFPEIVKEFKKVKIQQRFDL